MSRAPWSLGLDTQTLRSSWTVHQSRSYVLSRGQVVTLNPATPTQVIHTLATDELSNYVLLVLEQRRVGRVEEPFATSYHARRTNVPQFWPRLFLPISLYNQ
jgi:hypothetical protein